MEKAVLQLGTASDLAQAIALGRKPRPLGEKLSITLAVVCPDSFLL